MTQGPAGVACTYSISPAGNSVPYSGVSAAVMVTAGTGCAWTATSNAASYVPATLAAGAIAQGSFFSVFGLNLGPAQYAQATSFPLPTVLGGVSLKVTKGGTSVDAYPVFVSANQINAILPSNAPTGDAQLTVTFQGKTSAPMPMKIAVNNFGIFSTAAGRGPGIVQNFVSQTELPLNTRSTPAKPGQVEILWGTGLGPITAPDNQAPPAGDLPFPVEVLVANKPARKLYSGRAPCCSGVDQIVFEVPADAPLGCAVPFQVKVGSSHSNMVTMAISADGSPCSSAANPFSAFSSTGGKGGVLALVRGNAVAQLDPKAAPLDLTLDLGLGIFQEMKAVGELEFNPLFSMPPEGTCTSYTGNLDLTELLGLGLGGEVPGQAQSWLGRELDAGKELTVTGPKGNSIPMPRFNADDNKGPYVGLLGGSIPLEGAQSLPLFLDGGTYTITGPGGKDIGRFTATIHIPPPMQWTNRDQIAQVDRAAGLTLTWSGGDPNAQRVIIAGGSADQNAKAAAGFFCFVPGGDRKFTVPPSILGNLPASVGDKPEDSIGALLFGTVPAGNYTKFTAPGLDSGHVFYGSMSLKTVPYK